MLTPSFMEKIRLSSTGRNYQTVKDQLARLSASDINIGTVFDKEVINVQGHIVKYLNLSGFTSPQLAANEK